MRIRLTLHYSYVMLLPESESVMEYVVLVVDKRDIGSKEPYSEVGRYSTLERALNSLQFYATYARDNGIEIAEYKIEVSK